MSIGNISKIGKICYCDCQAFQVWWVYLEYKQYGMDYNMNGIYNMCGFGQ